MAKKVRSRGKGPIGDHIILPAHVLAQREADHDRLMQIERLQHAARFGHVQDAVLKSQVEQMA